jgi:hypothetical protein
MKTWDIEQRAVNSRSIYYSCGPHVTVIEVKADDGPRFICLTDRCVKCVHTDAVRAHLKAPYV